MALSEGDAVILRTSVIHFVLSVVLNAIVFLHFFRRAYFSVSPQLICLLCLTDVVFSCFALAEFIWTFVDDELIEKLSNRNKNEKLEYDLYDEYQDAAFIATRVVLCVTTQLCIHRYIIVCHPRRIISLKPHLVMVILWTFFTVGILQSSHLLAKHCGDDREDQVIIFKLLLTSVPLLIVTIIVTSLTVNQLKRQWSNRNSKTRQLKQSVTAIILITLTSFFLMMPSIFEIVIKTTIEKDDDTTSHADENLAIYITSLYIIYSGSWLRPLILVIVGWKNIKQTLIKLIFN